MKVLVIYDLIPEATKRAIVEMTPEEYEYFSQAHNVVENVNDDETTGAVVNVINNAFSDNPDHLKYAETDKEREYFGKWKSDESNTDLTGVDRLIVTGFYL